MALPLSQDFEIVLPEQRTLDTAKDLAAGAVGGVVQVLIGQPFDLVKVRLQANGACSVLGTVRDIWKNGGPLAFYKGTLAPLIANGACVSIQFGAFHAARQLFEAHNQSKQSGSIAKLSTVQSYAAGGIAGIANSALSGPVEHIRIRLQMQPEGCKRLYSGPGDCMQTIVRQSGFLGLWRGQGVTLLREAHGYGMYFATYEGLIRLTSQWSQQTREELPSWKIAACGAFAGNALWLSVYPLDVIKTRLQSDAFGEFRAYHGVLDACKKTWRQGRFLAFFPGLIPTLVRSTCTSAGTFLAVEQIKKALR